ncbi:MAG: hypothetical protein CVU41_08665 [Chloroflexi bacterium HGW-Chloroflexi-3]|nr:MAG: hypothetical protein CVU41_08665 [Chloroflexi bacterium HGW-Chloroflexi-3]
MEKSVKKFISLPPEKIMEGVILMADHIGISGSISEVYDLYDAVFKEQQKAKHYVKEFNEAMENDFSELKDKKRKNNKS